MSDPGGRAGRGRSEPAAFSGRSAVRRDGRRDPSRRGPARRRRRRRSRFRDGFRDAQTAQKPAQNFTAMVSTELCERAPRHPGSTAYHRYAELVPRAATKRPRAPATGDAPGTAAPAADMHPRIGCHRPPMPPRAPPPRSLHRRITPATCIRLHTQNATLTRHFNASSPSTMPPLSSVFIRVLYYITTIIKDQQLGYGCCVRYVCFSLIFLIYNCVHIGYVLSSE